MQLICQEKIIKGNYKLGLFSDTHIDSLDCNRSQLEKDLKWAYDNCDELVFNGDIFSMILPTDRKRFVRSQSMFSSDAQINEIVDYVAEFLNPYAKKISIIGLGNHETAMMKWNNYNPIQGLVDRLNFVNKTDIKMAGYKDFLRWKFKYHKNGSTTTFDMLKFHGAGGSAPVTKGMIDLSRLGGTFIADMIWIGHKHTAIVNNSSPQIYVSSNNRIKEKQTIGLITPGYHKIVEEKEHYDLSYSENCFNGVSAQNGFAVCDFYYSASVLQRDVFIRQVNV